MTEMNRVRADIANYDYIRFTIYDISGRSRGQVIPSRNAAEYLERGLDMYQGMVSMGIENEALTCQHENSYNHGNMTMFPDLGTLRPIPWSGKGKFKVAEILCESRWKKDNSPQEVCPRYVARKQLKRLDDLGLKLKSGFEIEYFLFHADSMKPLFDGKEYLDNRQHNKHGQILFEFDQQLFASGLEIERFHSEYSPGMFEAITKPMFGIKSPDSAINLKQGLLEMGDLNGLRTSFISRYFKNENGVGNHFSFSLWSKESGENVFYDAKAPDSLSETARQWIAGILKHSKALTALTSPTPNCYRRLHKPWAPGGIFWGIEDRDASLRVKNHGPNGTYFENRMPSGKSNPYIVVAATIAAGLDGVINKLECPPQGTLKEAESLPESLPEAMRALKSDAILVDSLGDEFVSWFLACKEVDVKKVQDIKDEEEKREMEIKLYL